MNFEILAVLVVMMPLLGAIFVGLLPMRYNLRFSAALTIFCMLVATASSWVCAYHVIIESRQIHIQLLQWVQVGDFSSNWAIYVDSLTAMMFIVVCTVSTLVHCYSIGYMSHDEHPQRFFAYLSLFTFCMLMLVSADNLLQLFFGWEGVGLSSYLLIGFWFKKASANNAAIKAFLVNRVGDIGLALAIFSTYLAFGTINYAELFALLQDFDWGADNSSLLFGANTFTIICLLFFIGCMGKSAQIGLHTWLPDAMEGPTPVSALIHAATMVTAGVVLIGRCSPLFEFSREALDVVLLIGAITSLFAATVALVQNDIKKIIAYSTCSQLGYMFFACGASAYSAGLFHLMTHAFFKALLFLGAGSVIHALSDEQDIRKMGGIWKKIPYTYSMMWIGSLALAGIYPFAGFFSKDAILEQVYVSSSKFAAFGYWVGVLVAGLTAFYSWRLLIMVFHGEPRASKKVMSHVHESPASMKMPLFILAVFSIVAGIYAEKKLNIIGHEQGLFWNSAIVTTEFPHPSPWVAWMPTVAAISGILVAFMLYQVNQFKLVGNIARYFSRTYKFLVNKWYFDEIYERIFVRGAKLVGVIFAGIVDKRIIDALPNAAANTIAVASNYTSKLQSGYLYHYAMIMFTAIFMVMAWLIFYLK